MSTRLCSLSQYGKLTLPLLYTAQNYTDNPQSLIFPHQLSLPLSIDIL